MISRELLQSKASDIQGYLKELEPILKEEPRAVIEDNLKLRTVERLFQLIVDTTLDINTHIIVESGFALPDDYQSTFMVLAQHRVITARAEYLAALRRGWRRNTAKRAHRDGRGARAPSGNKASFQYRTALRCG